MKNRTKISFLFLVVITAGIIATVAYSFNIDKSVNVNINNIYVDDEYLNTAYIDYSTNGKKVVSLDINIKNNSFYKIAYSDLISDDFNSLTTSSQIEDEKMINLSIFDEKTIHCHILVDENITTDDLRSSISSAKVEIERYIVGDGSYFDLNVDSVDVDNKNN